MIESSAFTFIISLAAVINGLGIVRWVSTLAEFLRRRHELEVQIDWTYRLFAGAQFLLHILLWWSMWGVRQAPTFNFFYYLYLLTGPLLLYLGTSLLAPSSSDGEIDLKAHYQMVRKSYWTIFAVVCLWAIMMWPLLVGSFAPTAPILGVYLLVALILRQTANPKINFAMALGVWVLLILFISLYGMKLGGVASRITGS